MSKARRKMLHASPCVICELNGGRDYNCHLNCTAYIAWHLAHKYHAMRCRRKIEYNNGHTDD